MNVGVANPTHAFPGDIRGFFFCFSSSGVVSEGDAGNAASADLLRSVFVACRSLLVCTSTHSVGARGLWPPDRGPADLGLRILDLQNHTFVWSPRIVWPTDGWPADLGLLILSLHKYSFVVGPRGGARAFGAQGSRATDLDFQNHSFDGPGSGICTNAQASRALMLAPTDWGPMDLGLRIWDLHNHSFVWRPRIVAR